MTASVVVYDSHMFLRLSIRDEIVDVPMDEADRMIRKLSALVPYRYGQHVWHEPIRLLDA